MQKQIQTKLLLLSLAIFLFSIVAVNAGTITAVNPSTNGVMRGQAYFLNYTYLDNATISNATQSMVFIVNGTSFNRLATNTTLNVSMNTSGFVTVLMSFNTSSYTERADYAIHINVTIAYANGTLQNDTLVLTGVDIDNTAPSSAVLSYSKEAVATDSKFNADCGLSVDAVDTALDYNISIYNSEGIIVQSKSETNAVTGSVNSGIQEFRASELNYKGSGVINCRVTDQAGFSTTSANQTLRLISADDEEAQAGASATAEQEQAGMSFIWVIIIFVVIILVILVILALVGGFGTNK